MTHEQLNKAVYDEAYKLRNTYLPPNHIWKALDNLGVKDDNPDRKLIFGLVNKRFKEDEANETEYKHAIKQEHLRQAAKAQRLHPESAYRNDL